MANTLASITEKINTELSKKLSTGENGTMNEFTAKIIHIPDGGRIDYTDTQTDVLRSIPIRVSSPNADKNYAGYYPFRLIPNTGTGGNNGIGIGINSGGMSVLASGESLSTIMGNEKPSGDNEVAWITSDNIIRFVVNSQVYANRKEIWIDTDGAIRPRNDNAQTCGKSGYRWKQVWSNTGSIQTSDERMKTEIGEIPDEVLDAWGEVGFVRFKYKDAVKKKGENARWHSGVIAQEIDRAFKKHGINAFDYGVLCYDRWDAGDPAKGEREDAGDAWSVRYDEALALECALQRRELKRIKAELEKA